MPGEGPWLTEAPRLTCSLRLSMLFPEHVVTDLASVSLNFCSGHLGPWTDCLLL